VGGLFSCFRLENTTHRGRGHLPTGQKKGLVGACVWGLRKLLLLCAYGKRLQERYYRPRHCPESGDTGVTAIEQARSGRGLSELGLISIEEWPTYAVGIVGVDHPGTFVRLIPCLNVAYNSMEALNVAVQFLLNGRRYVAVALRPLDLFIAGIGNGVKKQWTQRCSLPRGEGYYRAGQTK
jgi:hypothetical protein